MFKDPKRVTCLTCIDGRIQLPVIQWIRDHFGAIHPDLISEPGMDAVLAGRRPGWKAVAAKAQLSLERNHSSRLLVVAHFDCRGNPVPNGEHKELVIAAVERVHKAFPRHPVTGLWVNDQWEAERLMDIRPDGTGLFFHINPDRTRGTRRPLLPAKRSARRSQPLPRPRRTAAAR